MFSKNFDDDWIWTTDLWCRKRPLCQLSHNHYSNFKNLTIQEKSSFLFPLSKGLLNLLFGPKTFFVLSSSSKRSRSQNFSNMTKVKSVTKTEHFSVHKNVVINFNVIRPNYEEKDNVATFWQPRTWPRQRLQWPPLRTGSGCGGWGRPCRRFPASSRRSIWGRPWRRRRRSRWLRSTGPRRWGTSSCGPGCLSSGKEIAFWSHQKIWRRRALKLDVVTLNVTSVTRCLYYILLFGHWNIEKSPQNITIWPK